MPSPSRSGTHRQVPGPFLCSPACSRPISFHVCLSVSKWPLVSTPVSWPLLGAISLTFLDSSPSVSRGPFIYRRHYVLVPLCPPFSLCHLLLPSSLSLAVLSPSVSPPPSFPCLSVSLKHSHLAQESNTAGLFFFSFSHFGHSWGRCRENDRCLHVSLGFTRRGNLCTQTPSPLTCFPSSAWRTRFPFQTHPFPVGLAAPLQEGLPDAP